MDMTAQLYENPLYQLQPHFSLNNLLIAIFMIAFAKVTWMYLKIWLHQQFLKKRGVHPYFNFPLGIIRRFHDDAKKGDSFLMTQELLKKTPKIRAISTHLGTNQMIILQDTDLKKDFFTDQSRYVKSDMLALFTEFVGHGLAFAEGSRWKRHRKIVSEAFRYDFMSGQIPVIEKAAREIIPSIIEREEGKKIDLLDLFQELSGELVFRIFFGDDIGNATINGKTPTVYLSDILVRVMETSISLENLAFGPKFVKKGILKRNRKLFEDVSVLFDFCMGIIERRRAVFIKNCENNISNSRKDFLSMLLNLQRDKLDDGEQNFSDTEILHEFLTFFTAGMDTTGHMLSMAAYYYQQNKHLQDAVLEEAQKLESEMTQNNLSKADVMSAFMKETLRLAGPAAVLFDRKAIKDHFIGDIFIPKGSLVNCLLGSGNSDPDLFKNPETFNYNRWIKSHADFDEKVSKNPYAFTPFSAGARSCIGQHLAMLEGKILFSIFISKYDFKIASDYDLRLKLAFVYGPADPMYAELSEKKV